MGTAAWYDVFANFYDSSLDGVYREHRNQALRALAPEPGMTVVDVGCGTGASFPSLVNAVGARGRVIGVDASRGMLDKARARVRRNSWQNVPLREVDTAPDNGASAIANELGPIHRVQFFLSLSVIDDWQALLDAWWQALEPQGRLVIADVHNPSPGPYARFVEVISRGTLTRKSWEPLSTHGEHFELQWQPSSWVLGGRFFVASGHKP